MRVGYVFNKNDWSDGEWKQEPDYLWWIESIGQYCCVARRNIFGAWCGFVGIDAPHPYFQIRDSKLLLSLEVHGGIAFTGWLPNEDFHFSPAVRRWWLGFDCMQDGDLLPAFKKVGSCKNKLIYKNLRFVMDQVEYLALQLHYLDNR